MSANSIQQGGSFRSLPIRMGNVACRVQLEVPLIFTKCIVLSEWWSEVCNPSKPLNKRTVEIHQLDAQGNFSRGWRLGGSWPCRLGIRPILIGSSALIHESCDLVFEEIEEIFNPSGLSKLSSKANYSAAALEPDGHGTYAMLEEFNGENLPNNFVWPGAQVKYLNHGERRRYELHLRNGKIFDADGNLFDTASSSTLWSSGGKAICVMSKSGNIFASKYQEMGLFHHSSFLAGQPVAFAGEIEVEDGKLLEITNRSGHYKPPRKALQQFMTELSHRGIDIRYVTTEAWKAGTP